MSSATESSAHRVIYVSFGEADRDWECHVVPDSMGHFINCACGTENDPIILDLEGPPPECSVMVRRRAEAEKERAEAERERILKMVRRSVRLCIAAKKVEEGGPKSIGSSWVPFSEK